MVSFNDPEKFAELERQAYDGQLDFNGFLPAGLPPAAEYRYFDRVQDIGYRVRHEGYPKDFARRDIAQAKRDYLDDIDERASNVNAARQYTESRIRMGALVNEIYKAQTPLGKLRFALEFVEITVHEEGLSARNLKEVEHG